MTNQIGWNLQKIEYTIDNFREKGSRPFYYKVQWKVFIENFLANNVTDVDLDFRIDVITTFLIRKVDDDVCIMIPESWLEV